MMDDFLYHAADKDVLRRVVDDMPEGTYGCLVYCRSDRPRIASHHMFGPGTTPVWTIAGLLDTVKHVILRDNIGDPT